MSYAINHCEMRNKIKDQMDREDFMEAVMERSGQIVVEIREGKQGKPHHLRGVEIVAWSVALATLEAGAREIASDMDVSLADLKAQASSAHISSC